jgi:hypothetical protein
MSLGHVNQVSTCFAMVSPAGQKQFQQHVQEQHSSSIVAEFCLTSFSRGLQQHATLL